jgi:hypothetical protein
VSKTLAELVAELKIGVEQQNSMPSDTQYEQAIKDAVRDLNPKLPYRNTTTLSIVSDTADYTLPDDFFRVIRFENPYYSETDGVIVTGGGLVPVTRLGQRVPESYTVIDGTMTLVPTPTYSTTRRLWYQAIHVLATDTYPNMDEQWASVMMIKARSLALSMLAGSLAQDSQGLESYRIGDVQVDKGKAIERFRKESADLHREYLRAIRDAIGVQGSRATYGWADVDLLP